MGKCKSHHGRLRQGMFPLTTPFCYDPFDLGKMEGSMGSNRRQIPCRRQTMPVAGSCQGSIVSIDRQLTQRFCRIVFTRVLRTFRNGSDGSEEGSHYPTTRSFCSGFLDQLVPSSPDGNFGEKEDMLFPFLQRTRVGQEDGKEQCR